MTNKLRVVSVGDEYLESSNRMIEEFKQEQFESVILIGFKDGQVKISSSKIKNTYELIGALEQAKVDILTDKI